jgi:hypothetical protein
MFLRTVASFLALVIVWAGFTTQESAISLMSVGGEPSALSAIDSSRHVSDGSVTDHHLDDQPGSTSVENLADQPSLFMAGPSTRVPLLAMSKPHPYVDAAFTPADPQALQRPPCATSFVA